jgi:hypothetical protein
MIRATSIATRFTLRSSLLLLALLLRPART